MRKSLLHRLTLLLVVAAWPGLSEAAPAKVRLAFNPAVYTCYAIFVALDKGYFKEFGIDLEVSKYSGQTSTQMPLLGRGDLDIVPVVIGPSIFNQFADGFGVKLIASLSEPKRGWNAGSWLVVSNKVWDSGKLKSPRDLRGYRIDAGPDGSTVMFLTHAVMSAGGLTPDDVKYSQRLRSPLDWLAGMRNDVADVIGAVEPSASEIEYAHLGHKWLSAEDVIPWFQDAYFASSAKFLKEHPDAAARFVVAYLKSSLYVTREVTAAGGHWTPELLDIVSRWSQVPKDVVARVPGPVYVGQLGAINMQSLIRQQDFWLAQHKIERRIDPAELVDASVLPAAHRLLGN